MTKQSSTKVLYWITAFISAFAILFVIGLLNKNFAFFEQSIFFQSVYPSDDNIIQPIEAISYISTIGSDNQAQYLINEYEINTDQTNFDLRLPNTLPIDNYYLATISTTLDPKDLEELVLTLKHPQSSNNIRKPIWQRTLNNLDWPKLENQLTIWQRNKKYLNIDEFVAKPPDSTNEYPSIATYFTWANALYSDQSVPSGNPAPQNFTSPYLEGPLIVYTYLSETKDLTITLDIQELNFYPGTDAVPLRIFNQIGELIYSTLVNDDGITGPSQEKTDPKVFTAELSELPRGVYRIETGSADVHISINLNQQHFMLANNPLIVDSLYRPTDPPLTIYTNSRTVILPAWHIGTSDQTVSLADGSTVVLDSDREMKSKVEIEFWPADQENSDSQAHWLALEKNHLQVNILNGSYISFSQESYFNLDPLNSTNFSSSTTSNQDIEYIIADYHITSVDGKWHTSTVEIPIHPSFITNDKQISFSLSGSTNGRGSTNYTLKQISIELAKAK